MSAQSCMGTAGAEEEPRSPRAGRHSSTHSFIHSFLLMASCQALAYLLLIQ